ncbi:MAG TPA: phosphoadenylyl-sulfate reductase [Terriglobales bacterium]
MKDQVQQIQSHAERLRPEEVLRWAFATFDQDVAISSGMGVEGMVLLDIASRITPNLRVFTIDTEFLFPETYDLIERIEKRYGIRVERLLSTLTPERQEEVHGAALWARNPDQCCNIRKIEPLKKKLSTLRAWITAIRRDQTSHRSGAKRVEWDSKFGLIKINPLVDWTSEMVWNYVHKHDVPYNALHDQNFPSIGCMHCTRAVRPGDDPRSGRWSGNAKTECGLHTVQGENGSVLVRLGS